MRKQTKIAALVSAAALLAIGASMTSFAEWHWNTDVGEWEYLDRYDEPVAGEWHRGDTAASRQNWYYVDETGFMARDTVVGLGDEDTYYVNAAGERVSNAWIEIDNENGYTVDDEEPNTVWLFFGSNGKAKKAASGESYTLVKDIPVQTGSATTGRFVFDGDGIMQTGWVENKYYCVKDGDDLDITVEGAFNYVLGQAIVGWAEMYDDAEENRIWRYFDNGTLLDEGTKKLSWNGVSSYYYFENGVMQTGDKIVVATASGAEVDAEVYDENGAIVLGNVWKYNDGWYYVVNTKDEDGKTVQRGVKFNSKGGDVGKIRVKSINGKLYAFDKDGKMLTGPQYIETLSEDSWNGIKFNNNGTWQAGWYYFNDPADPLASSAGEMVTGRKSHTDDDGNVFYRYYTKNGAVANEVRSGYLYGADTLLVVPEDGDSFATYGNADDSITIYTSNTKPGDPITLKAGECFIVDKNGRIVRGTTGATSNGHRVLVNDTYYLVKNYVATVDEKQD